MSEHKDEASKGYAGIAAYYRNLAIKLGAKPEQMVDKVDYSLCQYQIDTCDIPPSITGTVWEELKAAKEKDNEMCRVAAKLSADLSDALYFRDKLLQIGKEYVSMTSENRCGEINCKEQKEVPTCECSLKRIRLKMQLRHLITIMWKRMTGNEQVTEQAADEAPQDQVVDYVHQ